MTPLAVGVLIDTDKLRAWEARLIELLVDANFVSAVTVFVDLHSSRNQTPSRLGALFDKIEAYVIDHRSIVENALAFVDSDIDDLNHYDVSQTQRVGEINDISIDVLIDFRHLASALSITKGAALGTWRLSSELQQTGDGRPIGFNEVLTSSPKTVSRLSMSVSAKPGEYLIRQSSSCTSQYSVSDTASNVLWKSLYFFFDAISEAAHGYEQFLRRTLTQECKLDVKSHKPIVVNRWWWLALIARKAVGKVRRKLEDLIFFEQWRIAYRQDDGKFPQPSEYTELSPPGMNVWADPFPLVYGGKRFVFIEECENAEAKGRISVIELDPGGEVSEATPIIVKPYHLSYPHIFEFAGELWLIPESSGNRTVELYRCKSVPYEWQFERNLMEDIYLVDCSVFEWKGRWWMMANGLRDPRMSPWDELYIFYAESPLSNRWIPHAKNPVVTDVTTSRPAGRIFQRDGRLYRPSQNSALRYGFGLNIMEITLLTTEEYREKAVRQYVPGVNWSDRAMHTLNSDGGLSFIDIQRLMRKPLGRLLSRKQGSIANETSHS